MAQFNNQTPQYPLAPTTSGQDRYVDSLEAEEGIGVPVPVTPPGLETEGLPESQLSQIGTTRVMSPNDPSNTEIQALFGAGYERQSSYEQFMLTGLQLPCQVCAVALSNPLICAQCGIYGHQSCIRMEVIEG